MRFLIIVEDRFPWPMEMTLPMLEELKAWAVRWTEAGKFEYIWINAGGKGGGAITVADSHEDLHTIMASFPAYALDSIRVTPIADLAPTLDINISAVKAMTARMQGNG